MMPPKRGEVWLVNLAPTRGHEQAGRRPALVISEDAFNAGAAELVIVLPITSTVRPIPAHVRVDPPEGGVTRKSAILCDAIRSISKARLVRLWGKVSPATMAAVEDRVRMLLRL